MRKKQFCFFQTAETGNRTPDSGVKGSGANHYPRAPTRVYMYVCLDRYRHTACVGLMWVQRHRCWTGIGPASDRHLTFDAFPVLLILTVHKHYITCTCRWPSRLCYFSGVSPDMLHPSPPPPPSYSPAFAPIVD